MIDLERLNSLAVPEARAAFLKCCGATRWAEQMTARRPYQDEQALLASTGKSGAVWSAQDWLEAFAAHPKIGELDLQKKFAQTAAWAAAEQAGATAAAEATLKALATGNRDYEARFGHIFIVCATGKTASEMLAALRQRLANNPDDELRVAAQEQEKITLLRLQKITS